MVNTGFTPEKRARFIKALASHGIVYRACKAVKISRTTVYEYRNSDPEFKAAWDEALEIAVEIMEAEAHRRAVKGTLEPVYHQGALVGRVRKYSDTLLIFLLKAHKPAKYRENVVVEHSGPGGGPIVTHNPALEELLKLDARELARMHSEALAQSEPA